MFGPSSSLKSPWRIFSEGTRCVELTAWFQTYHSCPQKKKSLSRLVLNLPGIMRGPLTL
jgi:hypothetical protein